MDDRNASAGETLPVMRGSKRLVAGLALSIALGAIALAGWGALGFSRVPDSMHIVGYAGHLGEWELTATLGRNGARGDHDLSGPMNMKHVGFCSKDGAEQKTGAMQVLVSRLSSTVDVKLMFDGVACRHSGDLSGAYIGTMVCPDRKPVPLALWVK